MAHTISFQYMEAGWDRPVAGQQVTDQEFTIPDGAHAPRVGEFVQLLTDGGSGQYVVLAVQTRIFAMGTGEPGWHTYITIGPESEVNDQRLLLIRE